MNNALRLKVQTLKKSGLSVRKIQKQLGLSSPSLVQHYLTPTKYQQDMLYASTHLAENLIFRLETLHVSIDSSDPEDGGYASGVEHTKQWVVEQILDIMSNMEDGGIKKTQQASTPTN